MARNHGRISTAIWTDPDFVALPAGPQRMYLFLLSQPNLNHAGLLPLTMNRWASRCAGATAATVKADLQGLAAARFVVVDAQAEELLVRTMVKNDGVYKQPRVMQRLVEDAQEVTSPKLQAALLAELDRLPLDELSDAPAAGKDARSVRQVALDSIRAIRQAYGNPSQDPLPDPSEGVSHTLSDTPPEGSANGYAGGSTRAHAPIPPAPSPQPPVPPTAAHAENGERGPIPGESPGAEIIPIGAATAQTLLAEWIDDYPGIPPSRVKGQVARHLAEMLAQGIPPSVVRRGLADWHRTCAERHGGVSPSALPSFVQAAQLADASPPTRRSTTDERVAAGMAMVAKYAALDAELGSA